MDVNFAFLCDYADRSQKLTAVGIGIDTIYAEKLPALHLQFHAVISLRFSRVEVGTKKLGVRIIDDDGKEVALPLDTSLDVESPPPGYTHKNVRVALGFYSIQFQRYGAYSVSWLVDGSEVKQIPFKVTVRPSDES